MFAVIVHSSLFRGALAGAMSAAVVDVHAFLKFQSWHDLATYSWSVATYRWVVGGVTGALSAAGLGAFLG